MWPARLLQQASYRATPLWSSVPFWQSVALGLPPFPSGGPFVTVDLGDVGSSELTFTLFRHHVFHPLRYSGRIRFFSPFKGVGHGWAFIFHLWYGCMLLLCIPSDLVHLCGQVVFWVVFLSFEWAFSSDLKFLEASMSLFLCWLPSFLPRIKDQSSSLSLTVALKR